jgi:hypothetical protein
MSRSIGLQALCPESRVATKGIARLTLYNNRKELGMPGERVELDRNGKKTLDAIGDLS